MSNGLPKSPKAASSGTGGTAFSRDRMQQSRFELKYLLTEHTAQRMRDFVRSHIDLDEYSVGKEQLSYPVHSLYLDSDDLKTYWWTINGDKNRFKLRLRYYDANPGSPIFFEVKRRMDNCIMKQRGGVRQEAVAALLAGHLPEPEHLLVKDNAKQLAALQRFSHLMESLHAKPKIHIAYLREAYVSADDSQRLTFDRMIQAEEHLTRTVTTDLIHPVRNLEGCVVLELKFTNRFPNWFRDLIETFGVMQCGAAKYVEGVQNLGSRRLHALGPVVEEPMEWGGGREQLRVPASQAKLPSWVSFDG